MSHNDDDDDSNSGESPPRRVLRSATNSANLPPVTKRKGLRIGDRVATFRKGRRGRRDGTVVGFPGHDNVLVRDLHSAAVWEKASCRCRRIRAGTPLPLSAAAVTAAAGTVAGGDTIDLTSDSPRNEMTEGVDDGDDGDDEVIFIPNAAPAASATARNVPRHQPKKKRKKKTKKKRKTQAVGGNGGAAARQMSTYGPAAALDAATGPSGGGMRSDSSKNKKRARASVSSGRQTRMAAYGPAAAAAATHHEERDDSTIGARYLQDASDSWIASGGNDGVIRHGLGRGARATRPAWMSRNGTAAAGAAGAGSREFGVNVPSTGSGITNYTVREQASSGGDNAERHAMGRGTHATRPAWMVGSYTIRASSVSYATDTSSDGPIFASSRDDSVSGVSADSSGDDGIPPGVPTAGMVPQTLSQLYPNVPADALD